jgi:hypothetical protein
LEQVQQSVVVADLVTMQLVNQAVQVAELAQVAAQETISQVVLERLVKETMAVQLFRQQ